MIGHIKGTILYQRDKSVVINVSGIGYRVFITTEAIEKLKSHKETDIVSLFTHLAVRENSMDLYGFLDQEELIFFEMLISISGIGPKSAISILSIASIEALREAVVSDNSSYLTKVSGVGKKSAQKIILELKDKISMSEITNSTHLGEDIDTLEALKSLGYSTIEARGALKNISPETSGTNNRLREALKMLGK